MTDFYRLGRQYACEVDEEKWLDIPPMSYEQRLEFNRGFDEATAGQNVLLAWCFVGGLCFGLVVLACLALFR